MVNRPRFESKAELD